jgi:hypothetical protein
METVSPGTGMTLFTVLVMELTALTVADWLVPSSA